MTQPEVAQFLTCAERIRGRLPPTDTLYTKGYKVDGWQVMRFHETRLTAGEHRTMAGL